MNKYELAVVVSPKLEDEAVKEEFTKIQDLITKFGGVVDKVDEWGKRRLAYEINKCTEGIYNFITFSAEANVPDEIEKRMRIRENVLRYLIVRQDA